MTRSPNSPPNLTGKRCFNHVGREAAARCPRCLRFFCRECVTEHGGRVICAACLRKMTAKPRNRGALPAMLVRGLAAAMGFLAAWGLFYYVGRLLLRLPNDFHEGTIWK